MAKTDYLGKNLKPNLIWISKNRVSSSPKRSPNFIRAIIDFAGFKGFAFIPRDTVERLRVDPYFKYCFSVLVIHGGICYPQMYNLGDRVVASLKRIEVILRNPNLTTDEDIYLGLLNYMNNFPQMMPHGGGRRYFGELFQRNPSAMTILVRTDLLLKAIDNIVTERNLTQRLDDSYNKKIKSESYSEKLEYAKLCMDIFNELTNGYDFTRKELTG